MAMRGPRRTRLSICAGSTLSLALLLTPSSARADEPDAVPGSAPEPTVPATAPVTVPAPEPSRPRDLRGERSLRSDVERIVSAEETLGWFLDAVAIKNVYPSLLRSVCATPPEVRRSVLAQLDAESRSAGVAKDLFIASGRRWTDASKRALRSERLVVALRTANEGAEADCPFWVTPEVGFRSLQTDEEQFTLSFESDGLAFVRAARGDFTYGGGGAARVLPGYGFRGHFSVRGGVELGGAALIDPVRNDASIAVRFFPAVPVIVAYRDGLWRYELESAAVGTWQGNIDSFQLGFRSGANVAISGLRTQGILPWVGIGLAYEHYFAMADGPPQNFLRAGFRVGAIWAP